jgi:hypothetical protein
VYVDFVAFILKRTVKGGVFALTCTHWKTGNLRRIASPLNFPIYRLMDTHMDNRHSVIISSSRPIDKI